MAQSQFPEVSQALIDELDRLFPEACPNLSDPERSIWFKVGQRDVVRFLKQKFIEQTNPEE